jgi:hypothetical protein
MPSGAELTDERYFWVAGCRAAGFTGCWLMGYWLIFKLENTLKNFIGNLSSAFTLS